MKITRLDSPQCLVGEGPLWDVAEQALYQIDIIGRKVLRHHPASGANAGWDVPETIGSMALRVGGGAIVALADGVYTLDFASGACELLAADGSLDAQVQLADGKVDRRGRFIVGSSDRRMKEARGKVYALDPGANTLRVVDDDIFLANGPCWSPDDTVFYHADSIRKTIFAYDYDIATGTVANRRAWAGTEDLGGIPDGATVDTDGCVWSAICEGGKVVQFRPNGKLERIVEMPIKLPGSVMFGGPGLDVLYVPSLSPTFLGRAAEPLDGCTFMIEGLGVTGLPEARFAG